MMITKKKELEIVRRRIVEFIRTQVKNSGAKGIVIGLSGGLDSAVVAVLCAEAIGKKNVHCIMMPAGSVNENDTQIAIRFAQKFKLSYDIREVGGRAYFMTQTFENMKGIKNQKQDKLVKGNLYARIRMTILYWYANAMNYMVVGTGNRSEEMTGYFTKYGDGGVDCLPIGSLYKTEVRALAKILRVPKEIIDRPPSAGLWEGQTDESELGISYERLDKVLERIDDYDDDSPKRICQNISCCDKKIVNEVLTKLGMNNKEYVDDIFYVTNKINKTWHKREMPPMPDRLSEYDMED